MSTLKMLRELRRLLKADGITFTHEMDGSAHPKLTVTHVDGRLQKMRMASSPQDEHDCIENSLRRIRRFAKQKHP